METLIIHIESKELPEQVANHWFSHPCTKVLDKFNNYVFGWSKIKYNNIIYCVHDLGDGADLSTFANYVNTLQFDYEIE